MRVVEGDVGGERVDELVLSHERWFAREIRVWFLILFLFFLLFDHFRRLQRPLQ